MNPNLIPDILAISLFIVTLFISLRAFNLYAQTHSPRLFILGLSLGVISLTAADNLVVNFITIPFNTYWFLYIGQVVSYLFILLSLLRSSNDYLQRLMLWHIFASVLLIGLLLFSPAIPPFTSATTGIRAVLSGSRAITCFGILFCYTLAFMQKPTRFSFLMSLAFSLLAFGQLMVVLKYFVSNPQLFDNTGDIIRLVGLATLLSAVLRG